jgi:hypothetical protein
MIFTKHPTFLWKESEGATGYLVTLKKKSTSWNIMAGYPASVTPASCVEQQCSKDPGILSAGDYSLTVQSVNSVNGLQSRPITVLFSIIPPIAPVLLAPMLDDTGIGNPPRFVWYAVDGGTQYQVTIIGPKVTTTVDLHAGDVCDSDSDPMVCEYTPVSVLASGLYRWKIRPLGEAGYGLWSKEGKFIIP